MKRFFIFCLVIGHILVNGVASAVHMTEDTQHEHQVSHSHLLSDRDQVINDDWQHEHEEGAHMHLEFQMSDSPKMSFKQGSRGHYSEPKWQFSTLTASPPVPPPTY